MSWLIMAPLFSTPAAVMVSGYVSGGVPGGTVIVIGAVDGLLAHRLTDHLIGFREWRVGRHGGDRLIFQLTQGCRWPLKTDHGD